MVIVVLSLDNRLPIHFITVDVGGLARQAPTPVTRHLGISFLCRRSHVEQLLFCFDFILTLLRYHWHLYSWFTSPTHHYRCLDLD